MISPVQGSDAPTVALHRYPAQADAAERPLYATWVGQAMARGLYLGFLAVKGEQIIAGAGLTLLDWGPTRGDPQPWRGRLVNVWTQPDHRRQGLARELVIRCMQAAKDRGITRLSLGTSPEARRLYAGLGFQASETEMWAVLRQT